MTKDELAAAIIDRDASTRERIAAHLTPVVYADWRKETQGWVEPDAAAIAIEVLRITQAVMTVLAIARAEQENA